MFSRRTFLAAILISSVLAAGCKEVVKTMGELQAFQNELAKKFGDNVHVNLAERGERTLTITFINSALNDKGPAERVKRAEETAQFVKARYKQIQSVNQIWVVFMRQHTRFIVLHYNEAFEVYGFDKNANLLFFPGAPDAPPLPIDKDAPTAGYTSVNDETDISTATFQLDGEPGGYGVTVLPHFKLQGDARRRKAPPPAEVSFYFASYSRKPRFGGTVPIAFTADGKPVMQGKAMFTGKDAEYSSVLVSYSAFRKMITAERVTIKLGAREYPLTPEQLESLQKMDAYVLQ